MARTDVAIDNSSKVPIADTYFKTESFAHERETISMTGHVRSVGFISKPGQFEELRTCLAGPLMDLLHGLPGFSSAIVLHAQEEPRNLLVLTFWESEAQAANNRWEHFSAVRKLLSPLIDLCTKVQTFQATLSQSTERCRHGKTAVVC